MRYRSIAELDDDVVDWLHRLPRDLELIVGVPRSGLLAASMLALHLNLPLTDVEGLIEGRVLQSGPRYMGNAVDPLGEPRRVLDRLMVEGEFAWDGIKLEELSDTTGLHKAPPRKDGG